MEFRDLFGDGSSEGNFHRVGCLHEAQPDGTCPSHPSSEAASNRHSAPVRRVLAVPPDSSSLPRAQIRSMLEAGDEICLDFLANDPPTDSILAETAHLLRKLRNTGISVTVSGLSTADKLKLSRLEWQTV